jgi:uncharacterized protein
MTLEYVPGIPVLRPYVDPDNAPFWQAVDRHKFVLQRCADCDIFFQPPRPMCPNCRSMDALEWVPSSGHGKVYSYVTFTSDRMAYPAMKIPYSVVLVELEEGVRLTANIVDVEPEDVYIGMPVEVTFNNPTDDLTLYQFKSRAS